MVTSGWVPDSWNTTLLPHHQPIRRKSYTLQPSPQILPVKTSPWKPSGNSVFLSMSHPFSLLGPAINLSLLQTLMFWFVWPHCVSGIQICIQWHYYWCPIFTALSPCASLYSKYKACYLNCHSGWRRYHYYAWITNNETEVLRKLINLQDHTAVNETGGKGAGHNL